MKRKFITAVFKGKNKSLGYIKGMPYKLEVRIYHNMGGANVSIRRKDDTGLCVYSNVITFFNNWDKISTE